VNDEVRIPDIEVIVGCTGDDIAVFGFYLRPDIHEGYDVVCGIAGKTSREVVRTVLQDALTALNTADWVSLDELHQDTAEKENDPPF
jgi:hypothetical protein